MEIEEIMKLIDKVSDSGLSEFTLEEGNIKLTFKADRVSNAEGMIKTPVFPVNTIETSVENTSKENVQKAGNIVKSPLVGTFYAASGEGKEPFVSVGDSVKKGQVIGIVEAMKLMNEVESEFDGTVVEILVDNEQVVEYGQPLIVIA